MGDIYKPEDKRKVSLLGHVDKNKYLRSDQISNLANSNNKKSFDGQTKNFSETLSLTRDNAAFPQLPEGAYLPDNPYEQKFGDNSYSTVKALTFDQIQYGLNEDDTAFSQNPEFRKSKVLGSPSVWERYDYRQQNDLFSSLEGTQSSSTLGDYAKRFKDFVMENGGRLIDTQLWPELPSMSCFFSCPPCESKVTPDTEVTGEKKGDVIITEQPTALVMEYPSEETQVGKDEVISNIQSPDNIIICEKSANYYFNINSFLTKYEKYKQSLERQKGSEDTLFLTDNSDTSSVNSSSTGSDNTVVGEEVVTLGNHNQGRSLQTSEKETEADKAQREAIEKKQREAEETRISTEIKNKLLSWVGGVKKAFMEIGSLYREDNYPPYQEFTAALQSFQHGKDLELLSGKKFSNSEKNEEISKAQNRRKNFSEKVAQNEMFKLYINRMEACVEAGKNMQKKGDIVALKDTETAKTCFHLEIEKQAKNNARDRNWLAKNFKSLGEAAPSIEGGETIEEIMLKSFYKDIWKYIQKSCENEGITCKIDEQKQFREKIVDIKEAITNSDAKHKELLANAIDAYNAIRQAELAIQKTIRDEVKRGTELRKQGEQYNLPFTDDPMEQDKSPSRMVKYGPTEGKGHIQEILDANAKSKKTKDINQSGMNNFVSKIGKIFK